MGGALNCIGVRSTLHTVLKEHGVDASEIDPWYFPTPDQYRKLLEGAGFRVEYCGESPPLSPEATSEMTLLTALSQN